MSDQNENISIAELIKLLENGFGSIAKGLQQFSDVTADATTGIEYSSLSFKAHLLAALNDTEVKTALANVVATSMLGGISSTPSTYVNTINQQQKVAESKQDTEKEKEIHETTKEVREEEQTSSKNESNAYDVSHQNGDFYASGLSEEDVFMKIRPTRSAVAYWGIRPINDTEGEVYFPHDHQNTLRLMKLHRKSEREDRNYLAYYLGEIPNSFQDGKTYSCKTITVGKAIKNEDNQWSLVEKANIQITTE